MTATFIAKITDHNGQTAQVRFEEGCRHRVYAKARELYENDFTVRTVEIWQDGGHDVPPWADQPIAWWTYSDDRQKQSS